MATDAARIDLARRALEEATRAAGLARKPAERVERTVPTGIDSLDQSLGGGFARGALYALSGEPGSGRASLALEWLLRATERAREPVAFIDGADALDAEGVPEALRERLLWVRARSAFEALSCAEHVIDAGGFAMVCLYLVHAKVTRGEHERPIGAGHWTRIVQRAEASQCVALAVTDLDDPRGPGSLTRATLHARRGVAQWDRGSVLDGVEVELSLSRNRRGSLVTHAEHGARRSHSAVALRVA